MAIRMYLAGAVAVSLALEAAARLGVPLINSNVRRIGAEYRTARSLGTGAERARPAVLFVGNSLTHSDIDVNRMQRVLGREYHIARWAVDDTNYLDWYYGLRRLFRDGARPRVVVVGGMSGHFFAPHLRGNYSAHYMLHSRDLLDAAVRTRVGPTGFTDLVLAHFSAFYGHREQINKRVLGLAVPGFGALANRFAAPGHAGEAEQEPSALAAARYRELTTLCETYGSQLVVWFAPARTDDPLRETLCAIGQGLGVVAIVPVAHGTIPEARFTDSIHLDADGAAILTDALALKLRPHLPKPGVREIRASR